MANPVRREMAGVDTSPLPGPANGLGGPGHKETADVHGQQVLITRSAEGQYPDDAEMIREKLRDQKVVVTPSGEYSLDEAGDLVFVPYPNLGPPRR
jgi:hypothetical protein